MRKNYPLLSEEMNDKFQDLYYKLTYILGYDDDDINKTTTYKGQFDYVEERIREAVSVLVFQTNDNSLILNKGSIDPTIPDLEYKTWGEQIVINELRSM